MPDNKKYIIEIEGIEGQSVKDADWWAEKKDSLYQKYPEARVFEVADYDENDSNENDQYLIGIPGMEGTSVKDFAWLSEKKDSLYQKYPDAKVLRARQVDYWYDKAVADEKAIEELQGEITYLRNNIGDPEHYQLVLGNPYDPELSPKEYAEFEKTLAGISDEDVAQIGNTNRENDQRLLQEKEQMLAQMQADYDANPRVVAFKEYAAQMEQQRYAQVRQEAAAGAKEYKDKVAKTSADMRSPAHKNAQHAPGYASKEETERWNKAVKDASLAANDPKGKNLNAANAFFEAYDYLLENKRSVAQGAWYNIWESVGEKEYNAVHAVLEKLEKKYSNLNAVTAEQIDAALTKEEKILLEAYFLCSEEEAKTSGAFQGGQFAGESLLIGGEMLLWSAAMYLTGGAAAPAAGASVTVSLGRGAMKITTSVLKAVGKWALRNTLKAAAFTAVAPTTYTHIARKKLQIGDNGRLMDETSDIAKYAAEEVIENFTEFSGEGMLKAFGLAGDALKGTKWGGKVANAVGNSKFGKAMSWLSNTEGMQFMGNLGFQGLPIEVLEELEGAVLNEVTGLNGDALEQFFDADNAAAMLIGFAPMTLFGAGASAANMGLAKHNLNSTEQNLYNMLSQNYSKEQIDNVINTAMAASTPNEVAAALQPLVAGLAGGNATKEQLAALLDYGKAVSSYKSMISTTEERNRSLIDAKYTEIESSIGDFWVKMAEDVDAVRQVRVAQLKDGRTVFVTSAANEQGEFTIKDAATGQTGFAKESDIAEQQDEQGNIIRLDNTMNIDDFLNGEVMAERKSAEAKRMSDERQAQIDAMKQRLAANKQINLGTEEAPQIVLAQSSNSNGVTVVDETGNSAMLTWEQVGNAIGTPLIERSDAQVVEQEIADLLARQAERKAALAQKNVIAPAQADKAITEAEQSIEAANPMHIPTNPDGSVDENAFWNENPEGWAEWNDQQNNDGGVDSYEQITAAKAELTARLAEMQKLQATSNPANRRQAKAEAQQISARLAKIDALEKQYAEKLQTPGQKRAAVEQAIKDRVEQWKGLTGAKFIVVENVSEVKDAQAAKAMAGGAHVMAWVNGNTAYVFLPNIDSVEMLDQKFAHEVVAHIGIKQLLGEEGYKSLCEKVWTVMSPTAQRYFLAYPAVKGNPILAADEYIAHIAEKVGSGVLTMEEQSVWQKIVQFVKEMLNKILGVYAQELTEQEILNNIKLSFANLMEKGASQVATEETQLSAKQPSNAELALQDYAADMTTSEMTSAVSYELGAAQKAYEDLLNNPVAISEGEGLKEYAARKAQYQEDLRRAKEEYELRKEMLDFLNSKQETKADNGVISGNIYGAEGATLAAAVNQKNNVFGQGVPGLDAVSTANYFYLYENAKNAGYAYSNGEINVTFGIPIKGNEENIKLITEQLKNGTFENNESADLSIEEIVSRKRQSTGNRADVAAQRGGYGRNDSSLGNGAVDGVSDDGASIADSQLNAGESSRRPASIDADSNVQAEGNTLFSIGGNSLIGLHNLTEEKLRKAIKQGGLANPSTAVVNIAEYSLDGYGEISLLMPSSLVDATTGDNIGTYTGDAWTPTYPHIIRQVDEKGWRIIKDKIAAAVGAESSLYTDIVYGVQSFLEDNRRSRLEYVFLKEKGVDVPLQYKGADGYIGTRSLAAILDINDINAGLEAYEQYKNARPMDKRTFNMWMAAGGNMAEYKKLKDMLKQEPKLAEVLKLNEDASFGDFDSFAYQMYRRQTDAGKVDTDNTIYKAAQYVDNNGLRSEFDQWVESLVEQAGAEEVFFAGYTRDGDRIYKKNTLENVSRHMRQQGRVNAYDNGGLSATKSVLLERLSSLSQIRKNKSRLKGEAEYNKAYDELKDRLFNIISSLAGMQEISSNQFMNIDYAEARLQEAMTKRNPVAHLNKEYGYEIASDGAFAKELASFIKDVKKMPAKYFETKFERPVYLNEFAAAVLPSTTNEEVKQALTEAGLPVFEYDSSVEGARKEATLKATEDGDIRFSILGEKGASNLDKAQEATVRLDNLAVAREMETAGKDAKEIKVATGWERGADKLWRYEVEEDYNITELENRLQEDLNSGREKAWGIIYSRDLGSIVKAYPDFNVDIMVWVGDEFNNTGEYQPATEGDEYSFGTSASIEIRAKTVADIKDVLAHEIQHVIQEKEGFAQGGNTFGLKDRLKKALEEAVAEVKALREQGKEAEADALVKQNKGLAEAVINNESDVYGNYTKLAGEVEARNSSARLGMPMSERRRTLAVETEDVAREDQIILMDALGGAAYEQSDVRFSASNANQEIFVSNAAKAVEGIKQEKATPAQWLAMLEKNGGLKAAEDKWMGLSDWLNESDKKTLTKAEVLDFINENMIVIEEQHYGEIDETQVVQEQAAQSIVNGASLEELQEIINEHAESASRYDAENEDEDFDLDEWLMDIMVDEYGDDFGVAYTIEDGTIEFADIDWWDISRERMEDRFGVRPIDDTRLEYTTLGLQNFHEIALTVPTILPWETSDYTHFGDAGDGRAVAWIRFGDTKIVEEGSLMEYEPKDDVEREIKDYIEMGMSRWGYPFEECVGYAYNQITDAPSEAVGWTEEAVTAVANGMRGKEKARKILVIDEIQSNRHQEGRKRGYKDIREIRAIQKRKAEIDAEIKSLAGAVLDGDRAAKRQQDALFREHRELSLQRVRGEIPDAPFEKNWPELAMKRMLRYAAENGYDVIAWTKGDQQAQRYDLSQVVKKISTSKQNNEGERIVNIYYRDESNDYKNLVVDKDGKVIYGDFFGSNLAEIVGKEMALQIMSSEDRAEFKGDGLRVGGEGMRGFYDKMLPAFMNKYGKKWGVKVEDINLPNLEDGLTMHSVPVTEEMKASVMEGQTMFSAITPHESSMDEIDQMFASLNRDPFVRDLYAKVSDLAHKMNLKIKFVEPWSEAGGANILDKVKYNVDYFNSNDYAQTKAGVLLHELIHSVTVYAVAAKNSSVLTQEMKDAVKQMEAIYDEIKDDPAFDGTYGAESVKEMVSELSNPRFRQKLRAKNLFQRIIDAIKQLLGIDKGTNALDNLEGTLEYMIENFDQNAFDAVLKANEQSDYYTQFSAVTDPAKIAELESGEKIKVYRAMQVIDGKLYPPMSAKVDGKMREPIELGQWEQAEERPDLVDAKGNFKLDKANKSSVPARYNPYIHTSASPLNDQFSSAQSRPNLVTVEVEIPASELTSGYKAEGAKDAVGQMEWKAGVVQSKLSGTRTVILSRWDKPIRIVPDSEVAAEIVKMFDGKNITMPSNVVTPSLRAELEKLGVPFVETDNQGRPKAVTLFSALPTKNDFEVEKKAMLGISMMHGFVPFDEMGNTFRSLINEREAMVQRLASKANKTAFEKERLARLEQDLEAAYRQLEWWENVQADLVPIEEVQPEVSKDMEPQSFEEYLSQFFTMSTSRVNKTGVDKNGKPVIKKVNKKVGVMLTPETLTSEMGWASGDWAGIRYIVSAKDGMSLDAIAEMIAEDEDAKQFLVNVDTMDIKNAVIDFLQSVGTYAEIRDYVKRQREAQAQAQADFINAQIQYNAQSIEDETGMTVDQYNAMLIEEAFRAAEENLSLLETSEINGNFEELTEDEYERYIEAVIRGEEGRVYEGTEDFGSAQRAGENASEEVYEATSEGDAGDMQGGNAGSVGDSSGEAGGVGQPPIGNKNKGLVLGSLETEGKSVDEIVNEGAQKVAKENADAADIFMAKLRKLNQSLTSLRAAISAQREYDSNTVKIITSLANDLLEGGKLTDMTRGEIKRLLSVIKDATGKSDLTVSVDRLMDIMIANQLRFAKNRFADLLKIKASKVNASGVEAQGKLDVQGQQIMQSLKDGMKASEEVLNEWIAEAENDLDSDSATIRHNAELRLAGYEFARQYKQDIDASEAEEAALREDLRKTENEGKLTKEQLKEYRETVYDAIRENKMARVNSYEAMLENMSSMLAGSVARAVSFREAEQQRVENIHHMANSDMQGMPADEHKTKDSWFWNNSFMRFLLKPLATFDQMLRAFAPKSRSGEGYLWNHFMGGWLKATENEFKGIQYAHERLDAYVRYNFGIQRWSDLFALERKLPKAEVTWWNAGKMETFEVSQGNLLYVYMVNKMADGRMKLRKMGITEEDVDNIVRSIDPRFKDLADWLQQVFLPNLREKYNEVHERLFGAPMAAIDNYFPIRVLANARAREVDLGVEEGNAKPSTITGNIIKRTKNSLALDILGSNAFDVVLGHIEEMERWAAFAEWNKDLNTLLSYKKFRNRVLNMSGIYGAGNVVWNNFRAAAEIAAGVYRPATKVDSIDKTIMNIAKGVTGAKISFRVYTAFKQLLSWPAFISDARADILAKNMINPAKAWKWSMENLPLFEKRWKSRQAGDSRLMETESDWKIWKTKVVEVAGRWGMTPNALVDAVTVAIGARSIYETRLKKYLDYGYSQEKAEEKAKRDATILFNESQQSNESAFLSQVQVDRTVASVVFTVFRNSSMGYQRMYVDAIRNLGRMMKPGYKDDSFFYMTKQMMRDGLTEEQAWRAADRIYKRSFAKNVLQALTFGFIVQLAWNLGPYLPYIFGGDDDDKKDEMVKDATVRALVGGPVEGLAGGNILSNAIGNLAMDESLSKVSGAQLPLASDIENTFKLFENDEVRAYNDLFNLAVQSFIGVNPQTISDVVVAVIDACNGDLETATEAMLCIMRILQVPQSQIENFYIDEIDFKADEAYDMTVQEFAERYAKYKVMRNAPLTQWMYTDEEEKKKEDKYIQLFTQKALEERKKRGSEEAKAWYRYVEGSEYKGIEQTLKDIRNQIEAEADAGRFGSDIIKAAQQKMIDLQKTPAFQKYMDAKMIKSQTDKLKEAPDWVDVSELKKMRKEKFDKLFKESNSVE